jgi:hypothetical protein
MSTTGARGRGVPAASRLHRGFACASVCAGRAGAVGAGAGQWQRHQLRLWAGLAHGPGTLPALLVGPTVSAALLAGPLRRMLRVQAPGWVARVWGRCQKLSFWVQRRRAGPTLLQLELPAAQQTVEWREPPRDVAGDRVARYAVFPFFPCSVSCTRNTETRYGTRRTAEV